MTYFHLMDFLLEPQSVGFAIVRWISVVVLIVAFCLLAARILTHLLRMDQTGWEEEVERNHGYRKYGIGTGDGPGLLVPNRILLALLRKYAATWFGALHLAIVTASGLVAIVLSTIAHS